MGTGRWLHGSLAGLIGGLLASGAMSLGHRLVSDVVPKAEGPQEQAAEDATVKVASQALRLVGRTLDESDKPLAGTIVHYAFGALVGAVYGAVAEFVPRVTAGVGLPFGVAVWLGAHVITVPAVGLAEPPTRQPLSKEGREFGLHLVYGVTTEVVRRLLRRK
jgi:putative membrane protein